MANLLSYTSFQDVLMPPVDPSSGSDLSENLLLQRVIRFIPDEQLDLRTATIVVFDLETTGLDPREDGIIEIGGIKLRNMEPVEEFSSLVKPSRPISEQITTLTGITNEELVDAPSIKTVLPAFLDFFSDSILIAHNAEFDIGFLTATCSRLGYQLHWPSLCTLKMSRAMLPDLPSKNLDSLAQHYQLRFESRHRSIGDIKVTVEVLKRLLDEQANELRTWGEFSNFVVERRN
jgi:DNA polymerase III epsilon subunit family exonuclease